MLIVETVSQVERIEFFKIFLQLYCKSPHILDNIYQFSNVCDIFWFRCWRIDSTNVESICKCWIVIVQQLIWVKPIFYYQRLSENEFITQPTRRPRPILWECWNDRPIKEQINFKKPSINYYGIVSHDLCFLACITIVELCGSIKNPIAHRIIDFPSNILKDSKFVLNGYKCSVQLILLPESVFSLEMKLWCVTIYWTSLQHCQTENKQSDRQLHCR